jgi:hypothetical protein
MKKLPDNIGRLRAKWVCKNLRLFQDYNRDAVCVKIMKHICCKMTDIFDEYFS